MRIKEAIWILVGFQNGNGEPEELFRALQNMAASGDDAAASNILGIQLAIKGSGHAAEGFEPDGDVGPKTLESLERIRAATVL